MRGRWAVAMGVVTSVAAACGTGTGGDGALTSTEPTGARAATSVAVTTTSVASTTTPPEVPTSTTAPPPEFVTFTEGAFFGRVVLVDFDPEWAISPADVAVTPGAISGTKVGPATLHFEDGGILEVLADTPGGNACVELVRQEDWGAIAGLENPTLADVRFNHVPYDCFLYGVLRSDGSVAWFDTAVYLAGDRTAGLLRHPTAMSSGLIVINGGLGLSVRADVEVLCGSIDSLEKWVAEIEFWAPRTVVEIDVDSGEVSTLSCLFGF